MKKRKFRIFTVIYGLTFSILACRPVVTIGWQEIGILVIILLVLLGPPLFKFYKRFDEFRTWKNDKDDT